MGLLDLGESGRPEGCLPLEGVQDDALDQITEGQVEVLGQALEDLQRAALDAQSGLYSFNCYHGTNVPPVTDTSRPEYVEATAPKGTKSGAGKVIISVGAPVTLAAPSASQVIAGSALGL